MDVLQIMDKKTKESMSRLTEEQIYAKVYEEVSNGKKREGLWAKSLANSDGNEDRAKSLYIKYRAQSIIDEAAVAEAAITNTEEAKQKDAASNARREAVDSFTSKLFRVISILVSLFFALFGIVATIMVFTEEFNIVMIIIAAVCLFFALGIWKFGGRSN